MLGIAWHAGGLVSDFFNSGAEADYSGVQFNAPIDQHQQGGNWFGQQHGDAGKYLIVCTNSAQMSTMRMILKPST